MQSGYKIMSQKFVIPQRLFFALAITFIAVFGSRTFAKPYSPESLAKLIATAKIEAAKGKSPVVMFDLDDTLTNTRDRTARILHDFANRPTIQSAFADDAKKLATLPFLQVRFLLADTMKLIGIDNGDLVQKANAFWLANFFTNTYCAKDIETTGASVYLNLLAQTGTKIVYLTGRDTPRMGEGTKENLVSNHFPTNPEQVVLMMKPDLSQDDLKFKESQYANVAAMGEVIGAFENEPANINSMANAFPTAAAIFLDTIHSPKPDVPEARVDWVENFVLPSY